MSAATDAQDRPAWGWLKITLVVLVCIIAAPIAVVLMLMSLSREGR